MKKLITGGICIFLLTLTVDLFGTELSDQTGTRPFEKRITVHFDSIPLRQAIWELYNLTGVPFAYISTITDFDHKISLHAKDERFDLVLHRLLDPFGVEFHLVGVHILLKPVKTFEINSEFHFSGDTQILPLRDHP